MESNSLVEFATRYTAAWCSQNAASVASFFAPTGSLTINAGAAAVGRAAISDAAQGFMTAFPDLVITMDSVDKLGSDITYHWTLTGTNTGPGGYWQVCADQRIRTVALRLRWTGGRVPWAFRCRGLRAPSERGRYLAAFP